MEANLKKLLLLLGVVCFSITSLSAATYNQANDQTDNSDMMRSAVPPAKYSDENNLRCFISADYTFWTARQDGFLFGVDNYYASGVASPIQGSGYYPNWYGNSGFKVGLGAFLNHDGWDLAAEYTWFSNQNSPIITATVTSGQGLLLPSYATFTTLGSQWSNQFNRIDLDMGRSFWAGHYLTLRPFAGLMGGWETQNLTVESAALVGGINALNTESQKWWGIGPYTGLDATFVFPSGMESNEFGIFLNSGFALPWSRYKVSVVNQRRAPGQPTQIYTQLNIYTSTPMIEMSIGVDWESWWNDHSRCFALSAAWENQVYFLHNQFLSASDNGNMILQGLTVKALFAF